MFDYYFIRYLTQFYFNLHNNTKIISYQQYLSANNKNKNGFNYDNHDLMVYIVSGHLNYFNLDYPNFLKTGRNYIPKS